MGGGNPAHFLKSISDYTEESKKKLEAFGNPILLGDKKSWEHLEDAKKRLDESKTKYGFIE